jgi:acetyl-CoA carboxylase biotin carboxyl carrier protein
MDLTEDDVLQILNLIDKSSFDFLQLELGDLKLTVSKVGNPPSVSVEKSVRSPQTAASEGPNEPGPVSKTIAGGRVGDRLETEPKDAVDTDGLVAIPAPMLGTFYVAPAPGAPPFVDPGSSVDEDTTVGLIEVMKVFSSVKAGVRGVITGILVENGQFVEYGQRLFLVRPDGSSDKEKA